MDHIKAKSKPYNNSTFLWKEDSPQKFKPYISSSLEKQMEVTVYVHMLILGYS